MCMQRCNGSTMVGSEIRRVNLGLSTVKAKDRHGTLVRPMLR